MTLLKTDRNHLRRRKSSPSIALVRCAPDEHVPIYSKTMECLGISSILTSLQKNSAADPILIDAELDKMGLNEVVAIIKEHDPDIVGVAVPLQHLPKNSILLFKQLREEGYDGWLVMGGHSPTFYGRSALEQHQEIDAIFTGEADSSFPLFAANLGEKDPFRKVNGVIFRNGKHIITHPGYRETNLDRLGFPSRDLTKKLVRKNGLPTISTSRGCFRSCSFCSVGNFYAPREITGKIVQKWQSRSASSVAEEMELLSKEYGVRYLLAIDEEFFGSGTGKGIQRAEEIAVELGRKSLDLGFGISCRPTSVREDIICKLRSVGLQHIYLGVESGSQQDLNLFEKGVGVNANKKAIQVIEDLGLSVNVGTIILHPWSTLSTIRENYNFLRSVNHHGLFTQTTVWWPYHGSSLTQKLDNENRLKRDGTELGVSYPHSWQEFLRNTFEILHNYFIPHYQLIAKLHNAHTFKWRSKSPGRSASAKQKLLHFEQMVNNSVSGLLDEVIDIIHRYEKGYEKAEELVESMTQKVEGECNLKSSALIQALLIDNDKITTTILMSLLSKE